MKLFSKGKLEAKGGTFYGKDVLRVGRWIHPVTGQDINMTEERLEKLARNTRAFADNGNKIPYPKGHNTDPEKNRGFWNGQLVLDDEGALYGVVDVRDEKHREGLDNGTIDGVSVNIEFNHTDPKGKVYDEVITHICSTNYPVVTEQGGFLKLSAEAEGELGQDVLFMDFDPDQPRDEEGRWTAGGSAGESPKSYPKDADAGQHDVLYERGYEHRERKEGGVEYRHKTGASAKTIKNVLGNYQIQATGQGVGYELRTVSAGEQLHADLDEIEKKSWEHVSNPKITVTELHEAESARALGKELTPRQKFVTSEHDALAPDKSRYAGMRETSEEKAARKDAMRPRAEREAERKMSDAIDAKADAYYRRRMEVYPRGSKQHSEAEKYLADQEERKRKAGTEYERTYGKTAGRTPSHGMDPKALDEERRKKAEEQARTKAGTPFQRGLRKKPRTGLEQFEEAVRPGQAAFFEALESRSGLASFCEALAGWDENEHPRDDHGRFSEGAGGIEAGMKASSDELKSHARKIRKVSREHMDRAINESKGKSLVDNKRMPRRVYSDAMDSLAHHLEHAAWPTASAKEKRGSLENGAKAWKVAKSIKKTLKD